MSSTTTGGSNVEIDCGHEIREVAFFQDGAHILTVDGGEDSAVRRWRTSDGHQVGVEMKLRDEIWSVAVSNDGEWIVIGTKYGLLTVWDADTHETCVEMKHTPSGRAIDVSPDSAAVATASGDKTALWDILTGRRLLTMEHDKAVTNVKFSPDGTHIATTSFGSVVQIFDSVNGTLLRKFEEWSDATRRNHFPTIAWSRDGQKLFAGCSGKITCLDADTGSVLSQWQAHEGTVYTRIALARQGFLVSSTKRSTTFWDASTFSQIGPVLELPHYSSLSADGLSLATGGGNKITIYALKHIIPKPYLFETSTSPQEYAPHNITVTQGLAGENSHPQDEQNANLALSPTVPKNQLPLLHVSHAAFTLWIQDDLPRAEAVLTKEITTSSSPTHIAFANRSLIHARIGLEKHKEAFRTFDLALADAQCDVNERKLLLLIKSIVSCMAGDYDDAIARVTALIDLTKDVTAYLFVQAQICIFLGDRCKERGDFGHAIQSFELARVPTVPPTSPELQVISMIFGWHFEDLGLTVRRRLHDTLIAIRDKHEVVRSLLSMDTTFPEEQERCTDETQWINEFMRHRVVVLERIGDEAVESNECAEALSQYMTALSLTPSVNDNLLMKWAKVKLAKGSWESAISTATEFKVPTFWIYRGVCKALESAGRWIEASECVNAMNSEVERSSLWHIKLERRLSEKLKTAATLAESHYDVIQLCSAALSLQPPNPRDLLVKRSKALALVGKWEDALRDADEVIALDPLSHLGYERRHAALLGAERYGDAFEAYKTMLSKLAASPDRKINQLHDKYINPSDVEATIREAIERTTRDLPRVLIDTTTGRMRNKSEQISAFFAASTFTELCASMTTQIDHARIENAVKSYYRYVMFSHTWEGDEPTFQLVDRIPVYELQKTLTNDKVRQFCLIVRHAGFVWAWSDTCCIDQKDQVVLQESLVSMFRWYHGSEWIVVFLRGDGTLEASRWISRVWTNQEYVAAKRIWFYTGNWTPYLGLPATVNHNHKEDPRIREAMVSSVKDTAARKPFADGLQPGLDYIREKLCVASTRNTTLPEDFAYSLLGIFSVSIPVIYGEGESAALGRLLGHLLTASGDASILAWTGESGNFNSCFPAHITVFQTLATSHLPTSLSDAEMSSAIQTLRSSVDLTLTMKLYDGLNELPVPSFSANRMKLPCIMFQLGPLAVIQRKSGRLYRAKTAALGEVDIQTSAKLHRLGALYLIHPWLNSLLLDRERSERSATIKHFLELPTPRKGEVFVTDPEKTSFKLDDEPDWDDESGSSNGESDSDDQLSTVHVPSSAPTLTPRAPPPTLDAHTRALRFLARLKQPFGALLLTLTDRGYQRVAADVLIKVQLKGDVDLIDLMENVRTIDVL